MTHRIPPLLVAVAALGAGGCGSGKSDTTPSPGPAAARAAQAPYGLYVRTVTKQDIVRTAGHRDEHGLNPEAAAPPTGRYRLVIAKGSAQDVIKVTDPTGFTVDMDMNVVPGTLKLTGYVDPSKAAFCGPEIAAQATYAFRSAATTLRLRPNGDPCADRDSLLTGTWAKS